MVTLLYFAALVFSVSVMCGILLFNKKIDAIFVSVAALVCINNLGRYLIAVSDTVDMAVLGTKVMYIGGIYCPVAFILLMTQVCKIRMPEWLKSLMMICATVVLGFVMTIGQNSLYYTNLQLVQENGASYLCKEYGPTHILYPCYAALLWGAFVLHHICNQEEKQYLYA